MRFAQVSLALLVLSVGVHAQNKVNPHNQIAWPTCSAGQVYVPSSNSCVTISSSTTIWPACSVGQAYVPFSNSCATISSGGGMPAGWISTGTGASQVTTAPGTIDSLAAITAISDTGGQVYSVKAYGAKGDGTTNDCTAITNTIAAMTGGGVLYFPQGNYITGASCHLAITTPTILRGAGRCKLLSTVCASKITSSDPTGNLFTWTAGGSWEDIAIFNVASPTSGSAILTSGTDALLRVNCKDALIQGFYDNADMWVGGQFVIDSCDFLDPMRDSLSIQNSLVQDSGDWAVVNSYVTGQTNTPRTGIHVMGGNAGVIHNTTVIGTHFTDSGILIDPCYTSANSLTISDSLVEMMSTSPIHANPCATYGFGNLEIVNDQLAPIGNFPSVLGTNLSGLFISGGYLQASNPQPNIVISASQRVVVMPYLNNNNTAANSYTTSTVADFSTLNQFGTVQLTNGSFISLAPGQGSIDLEGGNSVQGITLGDGNGNKGYFGCYYASSECRFIAIRDGAAGFTWYNHANGTLEMSLNTASGILKIPALANSAGIGTDSGGNLVSLGSHGTIGFATGNLTAVTAGQMFSPFYNPAARQISWLGASAPVFTCTGNPTVTLEDCGGSVTCATPTALQSVGMTAGNTIWGTGSSATLPAGHYIAWEITGGTCSALSVSGSATF